MTHIIGTIASSIQGNLTPSTGYYLIASATMPTGASPKSVTFTGIPQYFKALEVRAWQIVSAGSNILRMRYNGNNTNYEQRGLTANYNTFSINGNYASPYADSFLISGFSTPQIGYPNLAVVNINDYASTTNYKTIYARGGSAYIDPTATNYGFTSLFSGYYSLNTNAITSIEVGTVGSSGDTVTGGEVYLYGML